MPTRRSISLRLAIWAGEKGYHWVGYALGRYWWPVTREIDFFIWKWKPVVRRYLFWPFLSKCEVHPEMELVSGACPLCVVDEMRRRIRHDPS
jgi:hypothetical protein